MSKRILIASRGDIAVRIARVLLEKGYQPLGVYTEHDKESPHRRLVVEEARVSSYTDPKEIVEVALKLGADAVHPGYGSSSRSLELQLEVARKGLVFIAPPASIVEFTRDKPAVKMLAEKIGVPTLPWTMISDETDLREFARVYGYPLIVKPAKGSWGRGLRILWSENDVDDLKTVVKNAGRLFGDTRVYVEPFIASAKHIEVQLIGDGERVIHLFERECSLQDDYLKILAEAPSKAVTGELRSKLVNYATILGDALRLKDVVTVEFLYDTRNSNIYLLEVNPGLTPEHLATEIATGVNIIEKQVEVALYSALKLKQENVELKEWVLEAVVFNKKLSGDGASAGLIEYYEEPGGPGISVDPGIAPGVKVSSEYTLLAKIAAWGSDRATAMNRLRRAISEISVGGVETNIPLLKEVLSLKEVEDGAYTIRLLDEKKNTISSNIRSKMLLHSIAAVALVEYGDKAAREVFTRNQKHPESLAAEASRIKRSAWFYYIRLRERMRRH
ncbi:MAG: acetyl-CoA carboxylase biotin carboxylase subunit family protein [Desulfurococcus sp.]|nr:acetyl-CoA carboxylase biotin carboxylase subunit family protein [Desulfurococcus sp.]